MEADDVRLHVQLSARVEPQSETGDDPSESGSRLARTLAQVAGPRASAGALRASGSRLLKQGVGQAPVMAVVLAVVTLAGVATTVGMPSALAAAIDAATQGRELTRALAVLIGAATVVDALHSLIGTYYGSSLTAQLPPGGGTLFPGERQLIALARVYLSAPRS